MCMLVSSGRCERLEDQLNDLSELHQNETTNLKQELASIEEKVAYQAYERARDMQVHKHHTQTHTAVCLKIEPGQVSERWMKTVNILNGFQV